MKAIFPESSLRLLNFFTTVAYIWVTIIVIISIIDCWFRSGVKSKFLRCFSIRENFNILNTHSNDISKGNKNEIRYLYYGADNYGVSLYYNPQRFLGPNTR